jgi:Abnormal spindle-like microcephaly-assoc'd, ASPM-SPD-2-Hydin
MRSAARVFFASLMLAALGAALASAQNIDFNLLLTPNNGSPPGTILNNTPVTIVGQVGTQTSVSITATYIGSTEATIAAPPPPVPQVLGSTEFTAKIVSTTTGSAALPIMLGPGQSFTFTVTYDATTAALASALVTVPYTEPGTTGTPVSSAISIPFTGAAPAYSLFYVLNNNATLIQPGGTVPFPATQLNTTTTAFLDIDNTGSGLGGITAISVPPANSPFKVSGLPPLGPGLPYLIASQGVLQLQVQYTPTAAESDTAQITITYQGGATATVNLAGSGITSTFSYKFIVGSTSTAVAPGGTITFPGANIGSTSSLIVQVSNTGGATGTINSVSTSNPPNGGATFTLTNPITLPTTLTTGNSFSVPLTFTPIQVGTQNGGLLIGNDFFTLSGQGLGSNLTYAYTSGGATTTVNPATGGAVLFGSTPVGKSEQVTFTVTNSGSAAATVSIIGTTPTNGPFTVSAAPKTLAPGQPYPFTITFTPTTTGIINGTLVVNTTSIPLVGEGAAPAALPSYTISGPSGNVSPASQSNVSLTLSQPYTVDLTGVLTLTTQGSLGSDPNVQFSTGSSSGNRTVDFIIPAGSTSADFAGQGSEIEIQTGTVAETVTLAPTFTTTGGVEVTPSPATTLQFTIPSLAPGLSSVQITNASDSSFTLSIIGYSTTRTLTSLNVTFNPATGFNLATTQFTFDLTQASSVWFQSAVSIGFGGQFQIAETFNLTGSVAAPNTLLDTIASVSATVSNSVGTSTSLQVPVQ